MNINDLTYLLKEPCNITNEQLSEVENILKEHPYFQAAHVLYLKGLKKQKSYKYNNALKTAAAYTTNRTVLFDFITQNALNVEKKEAKEDKILHNSEIIDLEIIEPSKQSTTKPVLKSLQIGEPLDFDKKEKHSFNEWLQLTSLTPISRNEKEESIGTVEDDSSKVNFDLIDQFLKNNPKIKPTKNIENIDVSYQSISENDNVMTETLARVYLEQKKYKNAIQAFKILSLKYPEKSSFFADRIKAVEFLQKNNS